MMKRETKRRIAYYQDALPDMKKRVFAAALMLMIAVIVSITATYAWVTLSVAPVVSSVNTTMSANGTLEIALSNPEGTEPEEFDIDESVTISTDDVTVSNLRWGNLVNLSHTSYGIDNLVLRPAQLNTASLKFSPLWGAVYGSDGRIETLSSDYVYTTWETDSITNKSGFAVTDNYGVRAIASYKMKEGVVIVNPAKTVKETAVADARIAVNTAYGLVPSKMSAMSGMLTKFAQSKLDGTEATFTASEIKATYELCKAVYDSMLLQKDAYVALANLQAYVYAENDADVTYEELNWDDLVAGQSTYNAASVDSIAESGVSLVGLSDFISDLRVAGEDTEYLKSYYEGLADGSIAELKWATGGIAGHQISDIVTDLIDYRTMTMDLGGKEVKLVELSSNNATDILANRSPNVYVYNGVVKDFEQLAIDESVRMRGDANGANVKITIKYGISISLNGKAYTKATGTSYFMTNYSRALESEILGTEVDILDTYGMAVDFWLRTNAEETYLTLEGAVVADTNTGTVMSYDGVNRVWGSTDNPALTTNSTTQGGGSCYIYYADTPEDMERSLDLLQSMKVAFVDGDGKLMATAGMDTQNYYAVNGRITVPLVVDENSGVDYTYTDELNTERTGRAIVQMTHDAAKWVTAVIYLDGVFLGNENVLAAADIDGQLNIQFGSSEKLNTRGDNELLTAERSVTATASPNQMTYLQDDLTTEVTVTVDGTQPETVTAFFVRAINSTQGERQKTMTFTKQADNTWTAECEFDSPGTYYLRHVRLDGVDYALENPPEVEISGFAVQSLTWDYGTQKNVEVFSPENYHEVGVEVKFATNDVNQMPKTVQARFMRDDGNMVNADLSYNSSDYSWSGIATFYTSGNYDLEYLLLDGKYYDVSDKGYSLDLSLGLYVEIFNYGNTSTNDEYNEEDALNRVYYKRVGVKIYDNVGEEMWELEGAKLRYSLGGSGTNTVDTDLTWDEENLWYTGTLPITMPGTYTFCDVVIGSNTLDRATGEPPSYTILIHAPARYVDSKSEYCYEDGEVQFAPLSNDAFLGPITITNSASAKLEVVVHNSENNTDYTVTMTEENGGRVYYDADLRGWIVSLPVYTDANGKPTQEGVWSVKSISALDCYDENDQFHGVGDDPIVWTAEDNDFSDLATEVSCVVNVTMTAGTDSEEHKVKVNGGVVALGDSDSAFMTQNAVGNIGMSVKILDKAGRTIPAGEFTSLKLNVAYDYTTAKNYGYEVKQHTKTYSIPFTFAADPADENGGKWVVDTATDNSAWQYVGEYKVTNLVVSKGSASLTYAAGTKGDVSGNGVPQMYTVTSAAPTADNLAFSIASQTTVFGKTGDNITGTFLQSYDNLGSVSVTVTPKDVDNLSYAVVDDMAVEMVLTYQSDNTTSNSVKNGGYTWEGTNNPLTSITLSMKEKTAGSNVYHAAATSLLAGKYTVIATVTVGTGENASHENITGWSDIEVFSKKPTVTMTAVGYVDGNGSLVPTTEVTVNSDTTNPTLVENAKPFVANNSIVHNGKSAVVFVSYRPFTETENPGKYGSNESTDSSTKYANYEVPEVIFKLENVSNYSENFKVNFELSIPGNLSDDVATFTGNGVSESTPIGWIEEGTDTQNEWVDFGSGYKDFVYGTETPHVVGVQSINTIKASHGTAIYTIQLAEELSIVQQNEAVPSVVFKGATLVTPANEPLTWSDVVGPTSEDGRAFTIKLPDATEFGIKKGTTIEAVDGKWEKVEGWAEKSNPYAIYTGTYTDGTPSNEKEQGSLSWQGWLPEYNFLYGYDCACTFYFDVYTVNVQNWINESMTATYAAEFGLAGWIVRGEKMRFEDHPNGITITVDSANMVVEPIVEMLNKSDTSLSTSKKTGTGETYKLVLTEDVPITGATVTNVTGTANTNQTTARNSGKTAAIEAARKTNNYKTPLSNAGYQEISSTTSLPKYPINPTSDPGESAIINITWTTSTPSN